MQCFDSIQCHVLNEANRDLGFMWFLPVASGQWLLTCWWTFFVENAGNRKRSMRSMPQVNTHGRTFAMRQWWAAKGASEPTIASVWLVSGYPWPACFGMQIALAVLNEQCNQGNQKDEFLSTLVFFITFFLSEPWNCFQLHHFRVWKRLTHGCFFEKDRFE